MEEGTFERSKNKLPERLGRTAAVNARDGILMDVKSKVGADGTQSISGPILEQQLNIIIDSADATIKGDGNYRMKIDNTFEAAKKVCEDHPDLIEKLNLFKRHIDEYIKK